MNIWIKYEHKLVIKCPVAAEKTVCLIQTEKTLIITPTVFEPSFCKVLWILAITVFTCAFVGRKYSMYKQRHVPLHNTVSASYTAPLWFLFVGEVSYGDDSWLAFSQICSWSAEAILLFFYEAWQFALFRNMKRHEWKQTVPDLMCTVCDMWQFIAIMFQRDWRVLQGCDHTGVVVHAEESL